MLLDLLSDARYESVKRSVFHNHTVFNLTEFYSDPSQVRTVSLANKKFAQHKYYTTFEDGY